MRSPLEPNVLEVAILAGWTAYGVLRERVEQLRARLAGHKAEPLPVEAPTLAVADMRPRQVDYSIN